MTSNEPLWRRYQRLLGSDPVADLDDELQDHLTSTQEALIAEGMPPDEARVEARRRFGDVAEVRRTVMSIDAQRDRRAGIREAVGSFLADLRYAWRMLRRSPPFTVVAALSIAIGVAANATAFSLVNAVLFRPLPGTDARHLVRVYTNHHSPFAWSTLDWFRSRATSFTHIVGERYGAQSFRPPGASEVQRVRSSLVTQGFFSTYQVPMALGRSFDTRDADASADAAVVLSHAYWQRTLGADSSIVGKQASVGGVPVTVVGVMAPGFSSSVLGWTPQILLPVSLSPRLMGMRVDEIGGSFYSSAQLRDGVHIDAATAELEVLMAQLRQTDTARYAATTVRLDHMRGMNAELRGPLQLVSAGLMVMVGLVLLIACANVANLLVGRASAREQEIGVRLALGATRARLIQQLLTESLLLAMLGTTVGLVLTLALTRVLAAMIPAEAGLTAQFFAPDQRVFWFTCALCLATTLLFGLLPSWRAASPVVAPMLRRSASGSPRRKGLLIGLQAGVCVVLLTLASQVARSVGRMQRADSGFTSEHTLDVPIDARLISGDAAVRQLTVERLLREARQLPGIEAAAFAAIVPMTGSNMETALAPDGLATGAARLPRTRFNVVSDGYFGLMGIPVRAGREFLRTDLATTERIAVINETAARRWWPNGHVVGRQLRWGAADGPLITVAGVVADITYDTPGEAPQPFVYLPFSQEPVDEGVLQVRARAPLPTVRAGLWTMLQAHAPSLPTPPVTRMREDMALSVLPVRVGAGALIGLGVVALLLAASGIYGLTAYAVARRTRELGIRAALGATRDRLVRLVLRESLQPVLIGALVGLCFASVASYALSRVLYGVEPFDPVVIGGMSTTLLVVAVCASGMPAWRVTQIDPVRSIRGDG